jgi:hypothetical protein
LDRGGGVFGRAVESAGLDGVRFDRLNQP